MSNYLNGKLLANVIEFKKWQLLAGLVLYVYFTYKWQNVFQYSSSANVELCMLFSMSALPMSPNCSPCTSSPPRAVRCSCGVDAVEIFSRIWPYLCIDFFDESSQVDFCESINLVVAWYYSIFFSIVRHSNSQLDVKVMRTPTLINNCTKSSTNLSSFIKD